MVLISSQTSWLLCDVSIIFKAFVGVSSGIVGNHQTPFDHPIVIYPIVSNTKELAIPNLISSKLLDTRCNEEG